MARDTQGVPCLNEFSFLLMLVHAPVWYSLCVSAKNFEPKTQADLLHPIPSKVLDFLSRVAPQTFATQEPLWPI